MKQYRQPLLTIFVIFATAYILTLIGCAKDSDSLSTPKPAATTPSGQNNGNPAQPGTVNPATPLKEIDPKDMRECTDDEFSKLIVWSNSLAAADQVIKSMGADPKSWKKTDQAVKVALDAIKKCDQEQFYHTLKPCKKMIQTIVDEKPRLKGAYDGARIQKRCEAPNLYLKKFGLRPDPNAAPVEEPTAPPIVRPPVNNPPPVITPVEPPVVQPPVDPTPTNGMRTCSQDEFVNLKSWRAALDRANINISKLGSSANWKFDANAMDAAQTATPACEKLIAYHSQKPCQRQITNDQTKKTETKVYSGESLTQQCATTRTYYYEFAQRSDSLITPNANLYLSTSFISGKTINPGLSSDGSVGICVLSNKSSEPLSFHGEKLLVTEARVYPVSSGEDAQMVVLQTAEGLKLECYGMDFPTGKTSKREVVRLLNQKDTPVSLSYELK